MHGPLQGGASNEVDAFEYEHGISRATAVRIADAVMAEERRTGAAPASTPKAVPRGNRHLDGYGHPANPHREVD